VAFLRKTLLATSLIGAGLASTTGAAFADEQDGLVNADDTQTVVPTDVCGNNVPVNVLGVQVPIQDLAGNIPLLSSSDDDGGNASGISKSCGHRVDTDS
jgi:hypothetical protein